MRILAPVPVFGKFSNSPDRRIAPGLGFCNRWFEIPEYSASDAPVVVKVSIQPRTEFSYRWMDGKFYRQPFGYPQSFDTSVVTKTTIESNIVPFRKLAEVLLQPNIEQSGVYEYERLIDAHKINAEVHRWLDAEEETARMIERAKIAYEDRCVMIDGEMWMQVDEPRWTVNLQRAHHHGNSSFAYFQLMDHQPVPGKPGGIGKRWDYVHPYERPTYRLDRLDEMKDYVADRDRASGLTNCWISDSRLVDIIIPDFLTFDDEKDNVVRTGDFVLSEMQAELRGKSLAVVTWWGELDQKVSSALKNADDADCEGIMSLMQAVAENCRSPRAIQAAMDAKARYALRPMTAHRPGM